MKGNGTYITYRPFLEHDKTWIKQGCDANELTDNRVKFPFRAIVLVHHLVKIVHGVLKNIKHLVVIDFTYLKGYNK